MKKECKNKNVTYKFSASNDLTECRGEYGFFCWTSISALVVTNLVLEILESRDNSAFEMLSSLSSESLEVSEIFFSSTSSLGMLTLSS